MHTDIVAQIDTQLDGNTQIQKYPQTDRQTSIANTNRENARREYERKRERERGKVSEMKKKPPQCRLHHMRREYGYNIIE